MQQVWYRVLHLESRSLRFFWRLFIPGQVTKEFFTGKQKRYPPPIRFFFVVMFIFLFSLNHLVGTDGLQVGSSLSSEFRFGVTERPRPKQFNLYELAKQYSEQKRIRAAIDSLPPAYQTPLVREAVDSLLFRRYGNATDDIGALLNQAQDSLGQQLPDSLTISLGLHSMQITVDDLLRMDAEFIIEKYQLRSWLDQTLLRQSIKSMKNPSSLIQSYLGSLAWTLLALIGLMAGVLGLLYWRQKRFYVEHFFFLLNHHSSTFILLTLAVWFNYAVRLPMWAWGALVMWLVVSPLLAMRRFYGQPYGLTAAKWFVFSLVYIIGFILLFLIGMLIVLMIF